VDRKTQPCLDSTNSSDGDVFFDYRRVADCLGAERIGNRPLVDAYIGLNIKIKKSLLIKSQALFNKTAKCFSTVEKLKTA
jgi:hypothetical protein